MQTTLQNMSPPQRVKYVKFAKEPLEADAEHVSTVEPTASAPCPGTH